MVNVLSTPCLNGSFLSTEVSNLECVSTDSQYTHSQLSVLVLPACNSEIQSWEWIVAIVVVLIFLVVLGISLWRVNVLRKRRNNKLAQADNIVNAKFEHF